MRNIFDQYEQPENRLTHALATVLDKDRSLLVPFLRWLGIHDIPKARTLAITEQQVPGLLQEEADETKKQGLPDAAVFDENNWAVLFESKVQAHFSLNQLKRHRETAARHGFESPWVVVMSVDELSCQLPDRTIAKTWKDVYSWFNLRASEHNWARELVQYVQVFEQKMLLQEYHIRGTITVFDGLRFNDENPYTYREGKRLIRLLGDMLQKRRDLEVIGADPKGHRRPAITGKGTDGVWDFIPLSVARGKPFTEFPHLTIAINRSHAIAAVTVPNGVRGGFKSKLTSVGLQGFLKIVEDIEKRVRPVVNRSNAAQPMIYVTQRHFQSQRSKASTDARLEADLRTGCRSTQSGIRYQPEWLEAVYHILIKKRSNIQLGIEVRFDYACPLVQSREAEELFAETWKAFSPLIGFALQA